MDNRLDLFNDINKYLKTTTDDDAILVLFHNKKDGDCFTALAGDWEILSALFSTKGYVNFDKGDKEEFDNIKKMILNTAYNICMTDELIKEQFKNKLL